MGSVSNAIKQLREESKYIHILSRAHKTIDESGLIVRLFVFKFEFECFSTMVSTKNA